MIHEINHKRNGLQNGLQTSHVHEESPDGTQPLGIGGNQPDTAELGVGENTASLSRRPVLLQNGRKPRAEAVAVDEKRDDRII